MDYFLYSIVCLAFSVGDFLCSIVLGHPVWMIFYILWCLAFIRDDFLYSIVLGIPCGRFSLRVIFFVYQLFDAFIIPYYITNHHWYVFELFPSSVSVKHTVQRFKNKLLSCGKVPVHVSDISHVTPLSKNYMKQSDCVTFDLGILMNWIGCGRKQSLA
jgi:hypothetical protein